MYGNPKAMKLPDTQATEVYMLPELGEGGEDSMGHREEFEEASPAESPTVYHVHPTLFLVISGGTSLPGPGPLSKFFQALTGEEINSS